jgi:hypothetical protein
MALYNSSNELFKDAIDKGLIRITKIVIRIGDINVEAPQALNVLDIDGWKGFLQNIIEKSDSDVEIHFVKQFLKSLQTQEVRKRLQTQPKQSQKKAISDTDVKQLTQDIEKCSTVEDILNLMGVKTTQSVPDILKWKRPTKAENSKLQYHCYNTDWYIERQEKTDVYYSIFNPEKKEIARYDSLKDAKNNMINIIKCFS